MYGVTTTKIKSWYSSTRLQLWDAANLHPSSYAPAWTVKSKKNLKKFKKFKFFLRETLTKVLSACKNSSWNHIPRRRGKKTKIVLWKSYFQMHFEALNLFFLPRLTGMWFHDEFLQALRTFVNVSLKKIRIFWIFFDFFWFYCSPELIWARVQKLRVRVIVPI